MAAAADIDDAIALCADECADASYDAGINLSTQFALWITGMFVGGGAIFNPTVGAPNKQRTVRDWWGPHRIAQTQILGTGNTDTGPVGTSAVIDCVFRVLNAVKFANANTYISQSQEDDVVALFNAVW